MVDDHRAVGDVETHRRGRAARARRRPAGSVLRSRPEQAAPAAPPRCTSGPAVDRLDPERPPGRAASASSDTGMSAPPVPTSTTESGVPSGHSRAIASRLRRVPPSSRLTRPRSRRLPATASEVVERPVEDLLDAGQPFHPERLHRRRFAATPGWYPRRDGPSERTPARLARTTVAARRRSFALSRRPPPARPRPLAPFYPTQSGGDRGTDVAAIQLLFRAAQGRTFRGPTRAASSTGARNPIVLAVSVFVFDPADDARDQGVPVVPRPRPEPASSTTRDVGRARASRWDRVPPAPRSWRSSASSTTSASRPRGSTASTARQPPPTSPRSRPHGPRRRPGIANAATWRTLVWHYEEPRFLQGRPLRLRPAGERELGHRRR